jgi:hypothetical protein
MKPGIVIVYVIVAFVSGTGRVSVTVTRSCDGRHHWPVFGASSSCGASSRTTYGAKSVEQKGTSFDTPSPYFHDGSATTLLDVVRQHGNPSMTTEAEKSDIVEFLRTIGFPSAAPRRRAVGH